MHKAELQKSLEALRYEVEALDDGNGPIQARMRTVIAELEEQIDDIDDEEVRADMVRGLPRLIEQFETKHPDMTEAINRVMVTLSNMGI
jgi:CHAD domain-containing protein